MLRVENLSLTIGEFMLNDVSFQINRGDYFVILGKNGAGKTLLLETIAGLNKIDSGNIFVDDIDITNQQIQKRKISIVYQDSDLFPHMNVFENIAYPINHEKKTIVQKKVEDVSKKIGIENLLNRKPETLSGGEYQKVSLARSLITGNKLLLLDEPLSALDSSIKAELKILLKKINREGITIIHVTHDYEEAISLASKIGILENGKLIDFGEPENIFRNPKSKFLASFVGLKNFLHGKLVSTEQNEIKYFYTKNDVCISCLTDLEDGECFFSIQPEEVSLSLKKEEGSNRNNFQGIIVDITKAKIGYEIIVDVGLHFVSLISKSALDSLKLKIGNQVWISFKASACKIYR